ncbi:coat f domain family, putative [Heliomicrobium modesticaldum Ice1]|uniref:Coat f domain family, putative n=1 Tax=Heliobacterium modesticaldum (strain ATCC 51547 / Ice1) TaxID=498761 RepID=B0TBT6_HELMI|nr:spore coat protein [Heliomicrobium modesticaldum]ABZ83925.1 coat f domain family, putative [Heliomicrobium modesticaldum Ice1]
MAGALKMRKTSRQSPKGQGQGNSQGNGLGYNQATGNGTGSQAFDGLTAQEMFWDMISTEKQLAQICNQAALDAGKPGLYQDLMAILNETQACHRELFHLMLQRGWYHLHPADLMQAQQVFQEFHSLSQSLQDQKRGGQSSGEAATGSNSSQGPSGSTGGGN